MGLKKTEGVLQLLGNSTSDDVWKTYSLIELEDGTVFHHVRVNRALDNYLSRAFELRLQTGEPATFWIKGSRLLAIKCGAKVYVDTRGYLNPILSLLLIGVGIPLCAVFVGFIVIPINIVNLLHGLAVDSITSKHPGAVRL